MSRIFVAFGFAAVALVSSGTAFADAGTCPSDVGPGVIPVWRAPKVTPGACSAVDIQAINTKITDTSATFTDIYNSVSPSCQSCVFSNQNDATWQVLVWDPNMAAGTAFVNFGACYAVAPGGSAACGKGVEDDEFCVETACPQGTCTDQNGCATTAVGAGGTCAQYAQALQVGCGSNMTALNNVCNTFIDGVTVVCGGQGAAGVDASAGGGGLPGSGGGSGGGTGTGPGTGTGTGSGTGNGNGTGTGSGTNTPATDTNSTTTKLMCNATGSSDPSTVLLTLAVACVGITAIRRRKPR
jgi:hypothetical protein